MPKLKSKIAQLSFEETELILNVEILEEAEMNASSLQEHYEAIRKLTNGKKHFALVDVTHPYSISIDGLDYAASPEALENRMAVAYCNPTLSNRLNINFLKTVRKLPIPMNIFQTKGEGLNWLREMRNQSS